MQLMPRLDQIKLELQWYTRYFSDNKLYQSAKWAGELLLSVTSEEDLSQSDFALQYMEKNTNQNYQFAKPIECEISDQLMVARNLYDLREFKKCASLLQDNHTDGGRFLHFYALYMFGEMRKEEEMFENENTKTAVNPELKMMERELTKLNSESQLHGLSLYLYGLVLRDSVRIREARDVFIAVLHEMPCFWSCWLELSKLLSEEDQFELPNHWIKNFWLASFQLEKFKKYCMRRYSTGLIVLFQKFKFYFIILANAYYNNQEFELSLEWFERLIFVDPFRYENLDTYSNILYIKENHGELANLALQAFNNNKYVPETCCVVGNYYSLMNEHTKAIGYFQKALKLDKDCLAAWTLMGHEYLEMKNISSAISSYRNAVEIDPKDFRAWYGLGQTYALQNMNQYALYYFSKAVVSRPKDARMWNAMADCYDKMDKKHEAMKCYERANSCKDKEGIAIHQLAKLYDSIGKHDKAVAAFEESIKRKDDEGLIDKEVSECLLYLARHYQRVGDIERASFYAKRLYDFNGPERDEANNLLQQFNSG